MLRDVVSPIPLLVAGETSPKAPQRPRGLAKHACSGTLPQDALLRLFRAERDLCVHLALRAFRTCAARGCTCGCAVLARDIPSLREVWGDGALYFEDAGAFGAATGTCFAMAPSSECRAGTLLERAHDVYARDACRQPMHDLFSGSLAGLQEELSHVA